MNFFKLSLTLFCIFQCVNLSSANNWFNDPQFQEILDKETHSKAYSGNTIQLLINGVNSFKQRKINITSADFIFLKTFEFWNDNTGKDVIQQLLTRAKAGAKVFIQFDIKGIVDNYHDLNEMVQGRTSPITSYLQKLVDESNGNVFIIPTNVPANQIDIMYGLRIPRDHEKYLITWKRGEPVRAITGGMNIGDIYALGGTKDASGNSMPVPEYLEKGWKPSDLKAYALRESDIEVIGPVTQEMVAEFIRAAEFHSKNKNVYFVENLQKNALEMVKQLKILQDEMLKSKVAFSIQSGEAFVRFIATPPHINDKELYISKLIPLLFDKLPSNKLVRMTTAFFLPSLPIESSINRAIKRNVKVDLLINSPHIADEEMDLVVYGSLCRIRYLLSRSSKDLLKFYEFQGDLQTGVGSLHQKAFSFGENEEDPFMLGSVNLDMHSLRWNSEGVLLIQSPKHKKQFDEMLKEDFSHSKQITLQSLEAENIEDRFYECFMDWVGHPLL